MHSTRIWSRGCGWCWPRRKRSPRRQRAAHADALAAGVDVRQDVWVSPNGGVRFDRESKRWVANKEQFDAVVIAHNGKCAERITSKIPSVPVRNLCKAAFGTKPAKGRMTLNSVYSLVFETKKGALDGAPVAQKFGDDAVLAFLGNNGRKLGWATDDDATEVIDSVRWSGIAWLPMGQLHSLSSE